MIVQIKDWLKTKEKNDARFYGKGNDTQKKAVRMKLPNINMTNYSCQNKIELDLTPANFRIKPLCVNTGKYL